MKRFLTILFFLPLFCGAQVQVFMVDATPKAAATYTVTRTWYLNFDRSDQGTPASSPWNNTLTSFGQSTNIGKTNMLTSTGAASTVSANNVTSAPNSVGGIDHNNTPDQGVWPDVVIGYVANFTGPTTYQITGLDNAKFYNVYIHFCTHQWDGGRTVKATIGAVSTTPRDPAGNFGEGAGSGLANTALDHIYAVQPSSGTINISFLLVSGSGSVPVSSIVIEESNIAHP